MQRLNPPLNLSVVKDVRGMTYLEHAGSGRDVVRIQLPYKMPDKLSSAITDYNAQHMRVQLIDGRDTRVGIRRIERTPTGSLLVRPRSAQVQRAFNGLGAAFKKAYDWRMIDKCYPGWCILPGSHGEEVWEFEWSFWSSGKDAAFESKERRALRDRAYWAVLASGMIAIRDRYDIPREEMQARCLRAVELGVAWCALMDQQHNDLLVYRPDNVERYTDIAGWTLPEIPDVPFQQEWIDPPS